MARGRLYTSEEDALLLRHSSAEEVNAELRKRGLPERSDYSIRKRRSDLTRKLQLAPGYVDGERKKILTELEALNRRQVELYERLTELTVAVVANALGVEVADLPPSVLAEIQARALKSD